MKTNDNLLCRLSQRRMFRGIYRFVLLFAVHQALTIPLLYSAFRYFVFEAPITVIGAARSELMFYRKYSGAEPSTLDEIGSTYADTIALTTSPRYFEITGRHGGMILVEKRPRQRTLLPFPFRMWGVYAGESDEPAIRIIGSDLETRRVFAFISGQEGAGGNFAASFIPDVLIYVFWISAIVFCIRRQKRKKRAEITTLGRFERFRDACLAFRDRTGRLPTTLDELGIEETAEFRDAFYRREFLCLSSLNVGAIGATSKPWRAPWVFGRRTYVALEDGSIVIVRGRRAVDFFYDVLWAAEKWKNVGRLYSLKNRLRLQEDGLKINRILKIEKVLAFIVFAAVLVTPTVLATIQLRGARFTYGGYICVVAFALGASLCLLLGIIPLPCEWAASFYSFVGHTVLGWI